MSYAVYGCRVVQYGRLIRALVTLVIVSGLPAAGCSARDERVEAAEAARGWLELLDEERYKEAFSKLEEGARSHTDELTWIESIKGRRNTFGKMKERVEETVSVTELATSEGPVKGIVVFSTAFENAAPLVERVEMIRGGNKGWEAAAYVVDESKVFTHSARSYLGLAETLYQKGDNAGAVKFFEEALRLEKVSRSLEESLFKVLIDDLASAYGVMKMYDRSLEVVRYGMSVYPRYPLFYYIEACVFAETGNREGAIRSLRKAFEFRGGVIAGEEMPDPRDDPSFRGLRQDPEFVRLVEEVFTDS